MDKSKILEKLRTAIDIDTICINSLKDAYGLHNKLIQLRVDLYFEGILDFMPHYRGEQNFAWDILPGMFRHPYNINDPNLAKTMEKQAVDKFEKMFSPEIFRNIYYNRTYYPYGKEWDLLFQAQHAGIKTTITDWSGFIQTALYFATEKSTNEAIENADGKIWFYMTPNNRIFGYNEFPETRSIFPINPFEIKQPILINYTFCSDEIEKRVFDGRITRQKGRFIVSANDCCHIPLNQQEGIKDLIFKVRVPANSKANIRKELEEKGFTRTSMYVEEKIDKDDIIKNINDEILKSSF